MSNIKPDHYRTGEIDHFESWYRRLPFNEFKAVMRAYAEKYMWREKENVPEDLDKAIYCIERLKKYVEASNETTK